jgi:hypothetical protein
MAQVKWLGEGDDGPDEIQAYGRTIKKGESVEINDDAVVRKAARNPSFEVTGGPPDVKPPEDKDLIPEFLPPSPGPNQGEHVKNAAFGSEEELRQHREASIDQVERFQEKVGGEGGEGGKDAGEKRGPGRPKGSKNDPGKNDPSKRPERIPPT